MMPQISIIVPVYNTGEILRNTVNSILNQTYKDFELLLIDDGSQDISSAICDEYQKHDCRVRVFHKEISGICDTRNYGISLARGKYIAFCDHDDLYVPTFLEQMVYTAEKYGVDVVRCGFGIDNRQKNIKYDVSLCTKEMSFSDELLHDSFLYFVGKEVFETIWNGIYRLDLLKAQDILYDLSFRHGGEDFDFNLRVFSKVLSMVLVPEVLYIHIIRPTLSTSSVLYDDILFNFINQIKFIDTLAQKYDLIGKNKKEQYLQEFIYVHSRRFVSYVLYSVKMKKKYSEIKYGLTFFTSEVFMRINLLINDLFRKSMFPKEKKIVMVYVLSKCFGPSFFYFALKSLHRLRYLL